MRVGKINLVADSLHEIRVEFFDFMHDNICKLEWSSPSQAREIVPETSLHHEQAARYVNTPLVTPYREFFKDSIEVSITCENPKATIYYAIDGVPDSSAALYTAPFYVRETCNVLAIAYEPGLRVSPVRTAMLSKYQGMGGDGLVATYSSTEGKITRIDSNINVNLGGHQFVEYPDPTIGSEYFTVSWRGFLVIPVSDNYTFYMNADDDGTVHLSGKPFLQATQWDKEFSNKAYLEKARLFLYMCILPKRRRCHLQP
ncbi:MAG: hypothetical protein HC896_12795 [Bacteroidales bacterium]|nr:hypothetical protein [Bacteroidales bacterium]